MAVGAQFAQLNESDRDHINVRGFVVGRTRRARSVPAEWEEVTEKNQVCARVAARDTARGGHGMIDRFDTDPRRLQELRRRVQLRRRRSAGADACGRATDRAEIRQLDEAQRPLVRERIGRQLTLIERRVVTLEYLEGLTPNEIGAVLDLPASRVRQIRRSIRERVRVQVDLLLAGSAPLAG